MTQTHVTQRQKLIAYLWLLHAVAGIALGVLLWEYMEPGWNRGLAILSVELLVPVSLWMGYGLVGRLLAPLELAATGAELIAERDFTSTYRPTGRPDTDRLIEVYNRMILELRQERLRQQEQEDFLQRLVEASPSGIVLTDHEGLISRTNPGARRLMGLGDEPTKQPVTSLPLPWGRYLGNLENRRSTVITLSDGRRVRCRAGEFRDRGFARRFYLLEELTDELHRSEKAAYDKLLRMVSHEVNNSVAAVSSLLASLDYLAKGLDGEARDDAQRALEIASERLRRMQSFIESLTQVIRLPAPHPAAVELDTVVDELLDLMGPTLVERGVQLKRCKPDDPLTIPADRLQLEQALLNVLKNAVEAMDGSPSKVLTVTTTAESGTSPGLDIADTGSGIDESAAEQLFTPFFSTKKDGCGIGLTLTREILSAHGWGFSLQPNTQGGATFSIRFKE